MRQPPLRSRAIAWLAVPLLAFVASAQSPESKPDESYLPPGKGKDLLDKLCTECHGNEVFKGRTGNVATWNRTIDVMVRRGAAGTDDELDTIAEYLAKTFPPPGERAAKIDVNKVDINKATAKELETGLAISPQEAEAIVRYREEKGSFKEWQDVTKVPGLDAAKIEPKKDLLKF